MADDFPLPTSTRRDQVRRTLELALLCLADEDTEAALTETLVASALLRGETLTKALATIDT